ncbi:MAG TPA: quinol:electron acceptor oxidoreductase subunit ActD [Chloroflexota bacterium]|jgi:hypothetical protein
MATRARTGLLGLYREPGEVARALDALRGLGLTGRDVEVLSGSPYPEGAFGEEPTRHRLYVFPFVGAACGFIVGLLVTIGTQISFPLVTGGKPILGIPPMINVMYEGTMLGAIIFTVLGVIFESRLPDWGAPYDPRISEGTLGIAVHAADQQAAGAARALRQAGAFEVIGAEGGEHAA